VGVHTSPEESRAGCLGTCNLKFEIKNAKTEFFSVPRRPEKGKVVVGGEGFWPLSEVKIRKY
jgi:hypothetical protein